MAVAEHRALSGLTAARRSPAWRTPSSEPNAMHAAGHRGVPSHPQKRLPDRGRQLGTADRLVACLAIDAVVAWRIHHLTYRLNR